MRGFSRIDRFIVFAAALVGATGFASGARADAVTAVPCGASPETCATAPIAFSKTNEAPFEFSFDTGFVPASSPLRLRVFGGLYAHTTVSMEGSLRTRWPEALTVTAPGARGSGSLGFRYGLEFGAEGQAEVEFEGKKFSWTGKIPFVPQVDWQVNASTDFDAWGFDPGVSASDKSKTFEVAEVGLGDVIGGSIPGADGGFQLLARVELEARYVTEEIRVSTPEGELVTGGPITKDQLQTLAADFGGAFVDFDVAPKGRIEYVGTIHLIPAFYVQLGKTWLWPLADASLPIDLPPSEWAFAPQRVHVPLPDVAVDAGPIDFGDVLVGEATTRTVRIGSAGEAKLFASLATSRPDAVVVDGDALGVEPGSQAEVELVLTASAPGDVEGTLYVGSNDPDAPVVEIPFAARARVEVEADGDGDGGGDTSSEESSGRIEEDSGCACRSAGGSSSGSSAWLGLLGIAALGLRRRPRVERERR